MQGNITNHHHRDRINTLSSISLETLMELGPSEPIPQRIISEFREKYPNKDAKDVKAYLAGFRMGLRPDAYRESKEYLANRKKETV